MTTLTELEAALSTLDDLDAADSLVVALKEDYMDLLWKIGAVAAFYADRRGKKQFASKWGCSPGSVTKKARVYREIHPDHRWSDLPENVFYKALEGSGVDGKTTDDWLVLAAENEWSSRQLGDAIDAKRGKKVSVVKWVNNQECDVNLVRVAGMFGEDRAQLITLRPLNDWQPSGEVPQLVRATLQEILPK